MWIAARILILLANVFVFSALRFQHSNFGIIAGLLCGLVTFIALFLWMKVRGGAQERLNVFDTPFLPMMRYPRTYWLTIGLSFIAAALANMVINATDVHALQLFGGLMALGAGMTLAVVGLSFIEKRNNG